jgi:hypothetical protein
MLLIEIAAALYILDSIGGAIDHWRRSKAEERRGLTLEQEWDYVCRLNDPDAVAAFFAREEKRRAEQAKR